MLTAAAILSIFLHANMDSTLDKALPRENYPMFTNIYTQRAKDSYESVAEKILECYRSDASLAGWRFGNGYGELQWNRAWEHGANHSAIVRIDYRGPLGGSHQLTAVLLGKLPPAKPQEGQTFKDYMQTTKVKIVLIQD